jgi:FlaA1/EpsC-like NDP-sugar epimerase
MVVLDALMIPLAFWTALTLRLGTVEHGLESSTWVYAVTVLASVPIFVHFGLYRAVLRFIAARAAFAIFIGVSASVGAIFAIDQLLLGRVVPLSAFAIYFLIATLYVAGSRMAGRQLLNRATPPRDRVAIYGAGEAGISLALALMRSREFKPVGFVDDDPALQGSVVLGIEVDAPENLSSLVEVSGVRRVFLALPSTTRAKRRDIIAGLEHLGVHVQTVPDLTDVISGRARVEDVREVDVADLLGRECVPPDPHLLSACIEGKNVLVTGAGGSIGSELCRKISRLKPKRLVLVEISEVALYSIDHELRRAAECLSEPLEIVPLLGSAHNKARMREVMMTFGVQTVYHAAAYKHVPMVEHNVAEGLHNNVFATLHTAEAAIETGVETFVLISTDKAVHPTNVMGATKRLAELVLQSLHERGSATNLCMVRFGNVLDSSGSVVPLFRDQIRRGGPVTVTHPDIIRYFMTIPEAAQLVIQAGSMARGGDVFVLDMGQPVRIDDLARRMISLMGLTVRDDAHPDGDIAIEYTGLRPGEKLFEELLIGKNVTRTAHRMILRALEHSLPWDELSGYLRELRQAALEFDSRKAVRLLSEAVVEYRPAATHVDLVAAKRGTSGVDVKVTEITVRRRPGVPRVLLTNEVPKIELPGSG